MAEVFFYYRDENIIDSGDGRSAFFTIEMKI